MVSEDAEKISFEHWLTSYQHEYPSAAACRAAFNYAVDAGLAAGAASQSEKMACGHPTACWEWDVTPLDIGAKTGECTACEEVTKLGPCGKHPMACLVQPDENLPHYCTACEEVRTLTAARDGYLKQLQDDPLVEEVRELKGMIGRQDSVIAEGRNAVSEMREEVRQLREALIKLSEKLRENARASREESGRIRRTVYVATDAEANCLIRAEVWDSVADELMALLWDCRQ
jgi:uncharacterized coiled-coil protein SlyX